MSRPVSIREGNLVWSGEHWINALRFEGAEDYAAWISLFQTRYSPVGEGTAAQLYIPEAKLNVVCADHEDVGKFTIDQFFSSTKDIKPSEEVVRAQFRYSGDIRRNPAWTIESDYFRVVAHWRITDPPVITEGTFRSGTEHFTLLFFTDEASVECNGKKIDGQPFKRDVWQSSIGDWRSSCLFALSETMIELPN